jgi:hypothetical protein
MVCASMKLLLSLMGSFVLASCARTQAAQGPSKPSTVDLVKAALPGIVLLLNNRPDGKVGFGTGLILDEHGLVVTNLHVVANARSIGAMLYDPARPTYSVMDGGLARFLFENHRAIKTAQLVKADPILDLALVRVDADTSRYSRLPFRDHPVMPGETVFALGHPGESAWSFTSGVVSAIQQGVIQHDAPIDHGSSGGPLIDDRGNVVGINTARTFGDVSAIGFARPIEMVRELADQTAVPNSLDLSTPERAVKTCLHAVEMASPSFPECVDWDSWFDRMVSDVQREFAKKKPTLSRAQTVELEKLLPKLLGKEGKAAFVEAGKKAAVLELRGGDPNELAEEFRARIVANMPELVNGKVTATVPLPPANMVFSTEPLKTANPDPDLLAQNGLRIDPKDALARVQILKMGFRVEAVMHPDEERAWVSISGRNVDGSEHHHSELWVRLGDAWKWRREASTDTVPAGWPPPMRDFNWFLGNGPNAAIQITDSGTGKAK